MALYCTNAVCFAQISSFFLKDKTKKDGVYAITVIIGFEAPRVSNAIFQAEFKLFQAEQSPASCCLPTILVLQFDFRCYKCALALLQ